MLCGLRLSDLVWIHVGKDKQKETTGFAPFGGDTGKKKDYQFNQALKQCYQGNSPVCNTTSYHVTPKRTIPGWLSGGLSPAAGLAPVVGAVWDRATTYAEYEAQAQLRRITNPLQSLWDGITLTTLAEENQAYFQIFGLDAELYNDGEYCGTEGTCLTGGAVPNGADAITIGHTATFTAERTPSGRIIEHEFQHVYDYENLGGVVFGIQYAREYASLRALGASHDTAYRNVTTERIAYRVDADPGLLPRGMISWALFGPNTNEEAG